MEKKSKFRKFVTYEIHLWIGVILGVIYAVAEFGHLFNLFHFENEKLIGAFCFVAILILISLLIEAFKKNDEDADNFNVIETKLDKIENKVLGTAASIISSGDKYLWDGINGRYYVFNPSFRTDVARRDKLVEVYIERFKDSKFKGQYIFLTGDELGKKNLAFFIELLNDVKKKARRSLNITDIIEVKEINKPSAFEQEMYIGTFRNEKKAIFEIRESYYDDNSGSPNYYFVFKDEKIINEFINKHFEHAWRNSTKVNLNI